VYSNVVDTVVGLAEIFALADGFDIVTDFEVRVVVVAAAASIAFVVVAAVE